MKGKTPWVIAAGAVVLVLIIAGVFAMMNPQRPAPPKPVAMTQPPATVAPVAPPAPDIPYSYSSKVKGVSVSLKLPDALADTPELHASLYKDEVAGLRQFVKESSGQPPTIGGPYENNVTWTITAKSDKLISLLGTTYLYEGGAHGNTALTPMLWDRALKKQVKPASLFRPGVAHGKLDALLCQAVNDARKNREGQYYNPTDTMWPCPKWAQSSFALAPSDQPGKAGGVIVLFAPYAIGPYADGPYEITLPQQAFHEALAPTYADDFAGRPPKVGDTTPKSASE